MPSTCSHLLLVLQEVYAADEFKRVTMCECLDRICTARHQMLTTLHDALKDMEMTDEDDDTFMECGPGRHRDEQPAGGDAAGPTAMEVEGEASTALPLDDVSEGEQWC